MTGKYEERWKEICAKAAVEKNPAKMLELIAEINRLLDEKFRHPPRDATPQNDAEPSATVEEQNHFTRVAGK